MVYSVFISYASNDDAIKKELVRLLDDEKIKQLSYNPTEAAGKYPAEHIKKLIQECQLFVPILTASGQKSLWVNQEIGYAEGRSPPDSIIPFVLDGVDVSGFTEGKHEVRFNVASWKEDLKPLIDVIKRKRAAYSEGEKPRAEDEPILPMDAGA